MRSNDSLRQTRGTYPRSPSIQTWRNSLYKQVIVWGPGVCSRDLLKFSWTKPYGINYQQLSTYEGSYQLVQLPDTLRITENKPSFFPGKLCNSSPRHRWRYSCAAGDSSPNPEDMGELIHKGHKGDWDDFSILNLFQLSYFHDLPSQVNFAFSKSQRPYPKKNSCNLGAYMQGSTTTFPWEVLIILIRSPDSALEVLALEGWILNRYHLFCFKNQTLKNMAIWLFEAKTFQNDWMTVVFRSELDGKKKKKHPLDFAVLQHLSEVSTWSPKKKVQPNSNHQNDQSSLAL